MSKHSHVTQTRHDRRRRRVKRLGIAAAAVVTFVAIAGVVVANNTQIVIGFFQGYETQNSFEPRAAPTTTVRENGIRYANDVTYASEYPNSHLDISYPSDDLTVKRPTLVFFHGGGFFAGDKVLGDPLAIDSPANELYDEIIKQGYNFVNVNYALVPEFRFPVPVQQMDQALRYLRQNAEEYHLDMNNVILMGSSAGAIMVSQYGALLSNAEYADQLSINPSIPLESVRGIIADDAPLDFEHFGLATKVIVGNYIDGTVHPDLGLREAYDPITAVTSAYPPAFLIGSSYTNAGYAYDMERLADALAAQDVRHDFFYEQRPDGSEPDHGLLGALPDGDPIAIHAFARMSAFLASTQN